MSNTRRSVQFLPDPAPSKNQNDPSAQTDKVYTFDEALALTRFGAFHHFILFVSGMCFMSLVIEITGIGIIMPYINCDIHSTTGEKSLLSSAGFFGMVSSSHAVGFLSDTWGRTNTLRISLLMSFITSFVSAFSVNIWMLIVFRFLTGSIMSPCQGTVYNLVGEFHSNKTRAKYVTMLSIFPTLALIVMPAAAMFVIPLKIDANMFGLHFSSWRLLALAYTFMRTIAIVGLFIIPETPKYTLIHDDHAATIRTMQLMYSINTRNPRSEYPVKLIANEEIGGSLKNVHSCVEGLNLIWSQTAPLFYRIRVLHTLNFCVVMFVMSGISHGLNMWLPTIIKRKLESTFYNITTCEIMESSANITIAYKVADDNEVDTELFTILIIVGVVLSFAYLVLSLIVTVIGKKVLAIIMIIVPAISCLTMQFITSFIWAIANLTILLSLNNCTGIYGAMICEFFPASISSMAMNLILMIARIGSAVGCSVLGLMIFYWCDMWFYGSFGLCLLLFVLTICLPDKDLELTTVEQS